MYTFIIDGRQGYIINIIIILCMRIISVVALALVLSIYTCFTFNYIHKCLLGICAIHPLLLEPHPLSMDKCCMKIIEILSILWGSYQVQNMLRLLFDSILSGFHIYIHFLLIIMYVRVGKWYSEASLLAFPDCLQSGSRTNRCDCVWRDWRATNCTWWDTT